MGSNLGVAYGRIVIDGSGAAKGFAVAGRGATGFAKVAKVSFTAVAAAGVGFGAAMTSAVSTAADFEQQLGDMRAVLRPTGQELNTLREQALKLGADTKFSAQEAAAAQTELAKGGLDAAQILGGALPGALALAAAGDLELARAAEIAVNTMEQFGLGAEDVTGVADVLAQGANRSTASVESLSQGLAQGGATAAGFGFTLADTVAALQALQASTSGGSDAGTSLKAALNALNAPTAKQAKLQRELGLELFDTNGEMKNFPELAGELARATEGMTKADRQRILTTLAGSDGQRALLGLLRTGEPVLRANAAANLEAGVAAETSAIKQDTLKGKLEELGGAVETIKIRVGSTLIPLLTDAAVATADWLSVLGNSEGLEKFGASVASGIEDVVSAVQQGWEIAGPLLLQLGGIGADALTGLGSAAVGAAPVFLAFAQAVAGALSLVLAIVEPVVSLAAGLAGVPGVAQGAAAALIALASALTILKAAAIVSSTVGGISTLATAAAASAANVGRMSAAISTVKAVLPGAGAALAALATPAGLAALAIGGVTAAVVLFGQRSELSATEDYAAALRGVEDAARGAEGAVLGLNAARGGLKDAQLAQTSAIHRLQDANIRLKELEDAGQKGTREYTRALQEQRIATRDVEKAKQTRAKAEREVTQEAISGTVALSRLATADGRQLRAAAASEQQAKALAGSLNITEDAAVGLIRGQTQLAERGATTTERMTALRNSIRGAAEQMDVSTRSGRRQKQVLDQIGNLNDRGLVKFSESLQTFQRDGLTDAEALNAALNEVAQDRSLQLTAEDRATEVARDVGKRVAALGDKVITITARDAATSVIASIASAVNGLRDRVINVRTNRTETTTRRTVTAPAGQTQDSTAPALAQKLVDPFSHALAEARTQQAELVERVARGFDFLVGARTSLDRRLAAIDAGEEARAERVERARLKREVETTARKLAKAKKDERQVAKSAANQARSALAEFERTAAIEARRRPLRLQVEKIEGAEAAIAAVEAGLSDVSSRITDSLQRAFDRALSGLDEGLQRTLAGIEEGLAASIAQIDDGLTATLSSIDEALSATMAAIDTGLRATMDALDNSAEAQRLRAIDAVTEAVRLARDERDATRRRTDLTGARDDAATRVDRLEEVLAGARTGSERSAASTLLEAARRDLEVAAEALADFEQDQNLARLARERELLDESLQQRRDAAQRAADEQRTAAEESATIAREDAQRRADQERAAREAEAQSQRDHHQALYDEARAAAERDFVARQAEVQRELGDLREQLRAGEINHKQFTRRLAAIYNDPTIKRALADSGQELGLDFARGLARSRRAVESNAEALADIVRQYLRLNSPAEKGPLAYDPREPGRVLGMDLAAGLASTVEAVRRSALVVAEAAQLVPVSRDAFLTPPPSAVGPAGAGAGFGSAVTHHNERTFNQQFDVRVEGPEDARSLAERLHWYEMTYGGRLP